MSWYACEQLERPPDPSVAWHYDGCDLCLKKAQHQARLFPDDPHVAWLIARMERR